MKKIRIGLLLMILFLIPVVLFNMADRYFSERTTTIMSEAVNFACSDIFSEISKVVAGVPSNYVTKEDGIYVDMAKCNGILSLASCKLSSLLDENYLDKRLNNLKIPFGQFVSPALLSNIGPLIQIDTSKITSYTTDLITNYENVGINNTIFEIYISILIKVEAFIPLQFKEVECSTKVYLVSMLLEEDTPIYYSDVDI